MELWMVFSRAGFTSSISSENICCAGCVMHIFENTIYNFNSLAYIFFVWRCAALTKKQSNHEKHKPKNWLKCTKTNNMHTHIDKNKCKTTSKIHQNID